jgi:hypothetical protein
VEFPPAGCLGDVGGITNCCGPKVGLAVANPLLGGVTKVGAITTDGGLVAFLGAFDPTVGGFDPIVGCVAKGGFGILLPVADGIDVGAAVAKVGDGGGPREGSGATVLVLGARVGEGFMTGGPDVGCGPPGITEGAACEPLDGGMTDGDGCGTGL